MHHISGVWLCRHKIAPFSSTVLVTVSSQDGREAIDLDRDEGGNTFVLLDDIPLFWVNTQALKRTQLFKNFAVPISQPEN